MAIRIKGTNARLLVVMVSVVSSWWQPLGRASVVAARSKIVNGPLIISCHLMRSLTSHVSSIAQKKVRLVIQPDSAGS